MRISFLVIAALLADSSSASVSQVSVRDGPEAAAPADVVPESTEDEVKDAIAKDEKKEKKKKDTEDAVKTIHKVMKNALKELTE